MIGHLWYCTCLNSERFVNLFKIRTKESNWKWFGSDMSVTVTCDFGSLAVSVLITVELVEADNRLSWRTRAACSETKNSSAAGSGRNLTFVLLTPESRKTEAVTALIETVECCWDDCCSCCCSGWSCWEESVDEAGVESLEEDVSTCR